VAGGIQNGSYRENGRRPRFMSEINVTPFVDVMLVLLIVFMVTAPMLTAGVKVDLPKSAASALPGDDEPLSITVRRDGGIYLQETEISLENLPIKLEAITKAKKDTRIFVRGDQAIDYGRVMRVVGAINKAGFSKVALVTAPQETR